MNPTVPQQGLDFNNPAPKTFGLCIYSRRKGTTPPPPDAVYVGRGTPWGNPHPIRDNELPEWRERRRVCALFEQETLFFRDMEPEKFAAWIAPLHGKNLVCWCAPKQCHAETLMRLANDAWACPWPRIDTEVAE